MAICSPGAVAHIAPAPRSVQVAEQPGPCPRHGRLAGQFANRPRHHGVHALLLHPLAPPTSGHRRGLSNRSPRDRGPKPRARVDALGCAQGLGLALVEAGCDGGETNCEAAGNGQRLAEKSATIQRLAGGSFGGGGSVLRRDARLCFHGQWDQKRRSLSSMEQCGTANRIWPKEAGLPLSSGFIEPRTAGGWLFSSGERKGSSCSRATSARPPIHASFALSLIPT